MIRGGLPSGDSSAIATTHEADKTKYAGASAIAETETSGACETAPGKKLDGRSIEQHA
ncbi:MAG TPA: hypothetical protein VGF44_04600 [Terriglobales bacterium]|jgi:hypothetical protein